MKPLLKGKGLNLLLILRGTLNRFHCTHNSHTHWTNVILKIVTAVAKDAEKALTHWHCYYWYLIARMSGVKSSMSGWLSAIAVFMSWRTLLLRSPNLECSCLGCRWNTLKHMYSRYVWGLGGGGRQLHMLPSHPMLGAPEVFNWGTLTNKQSHQFLPLLQTLGFGHLQHTHHCLHTGTLHLLQQAETYHYHLHHSLTRTRMRETLKVYEKVLVFHRL